MVKVCRFTGPNQSILLFLPIVYWLLLLLPAVAIADSPTLLDPQAQKEKAFKLPPCKACTTLVTSFQAGLERTSRGKHAGGDAAWEEGKLRAYRSSEVRLVEVQEGLCREVTRASDQCHTLANDYEQLLEEWFNNYQNSSELQQWLCVEQLKVCCPNGHYGPHCRSCTDCHGNGKCKGEGTRKGSGQCLCDNGYSGDHCDRCASGFYESYKDDEKLLCSECHRSCVKDDGCTGPGPQACAKCNSGWQWHDSKGCQDINECLTKTRPCRPNQFCVNDEGKFSCLECDRSCDGCDGDGPDMCRKCTVGYSLKDGKCQDESDERRDWYVNLTRFLTYFGLCVATCVIFQSSTHIAYIVGAAVAIYIATSEYWLNATSKSSTQTQDDSKLVEDVLMKLL